MKQVEGTTSPGRSVLVTGGAGFIGSHLVDRLVDDGWQVTIVDNFNTYYDQALKRANISPHLRNPQVRLFEVDIRDREALLTRVKGGFDVIVHLAALAGVRPSMKDPAGYYETNVHGTQNMLDLARTRGVGQFVFGSSSSVYGMNPNIPWKELDQLMPASPYAMSKIHGEQLGNMYSEAYGIRFIGLRFFSVYGPRQRPDLAITKFARLMLKGEPIPIFGNGSSRRDYTYIADIVDGIRAAMTYTARSFEVFNLGNSETVTLKEMIETLEQVLSVDAHRLHLPEQPGDVPQTWADVSYAAEHLDYRPTTHLREGLTHLCAWLMDPGAHKAAMPRLSSRTGAAILSDEEVGNRA